jgi:L-amino acid N-acyltransferase YncA
MTTGLTVRPAAERDQDAIWNIFHEVVVAGDTWVFDANTPRSFAMDYWFHPGTRPYVAEKGGQIVGTYLLRANQPGHGSHVANAGYMVAPSARGLGVGKAMGEHSIAEARRLGFTAMQFNFVVSTNESAVRLWKAIGFEIVGTLPDAFRHSTLGFVDVYVMFRRL